MKKFASLIVLFTAALHGQTICSFIGTSTCANTLLTYGTPAVPVKLLYNGYNPGVLPAPAQYVTYMQGAAPNVTTTYTTTFTSVAGSTGSISVMCDDLCTVTLNGVKVGATTAAQYNKVIAMAIPPTALVTGLNTLTIAVTNTGGNTGVGFYSVITPPSTNLFQSNCTGTLSADGRTITTIPPCTWTKVGP
jgi:hypothetical protein